MRLYGSFHRHPKTVVLSMGARGLWATLSSWSTDCDTRGAVPDAVIAKEAPRASERGRWIAELLAHGWLERVDGGHQLHNYCDRNPAAADIEAKRAMARDRKRRQRDGHAGPARVSRGTDRDASRDVTPTEVELEREPEGPPVVPPGDERVTPAVIEVEFSRRPSPPRPYLPGEDPEGFRAAFTAAYRTHHRDALPVGGL